MAERLRLRTKDKPLKNMVDRGIFDSGCSGHMTGNKDQLEDFEEFNRGICYLWSFDIKTPTPAKGRTWDLQCKAGVISSLFFKQFWQTAIANTLADGTLELHATIDTTVYTITKASIRNKLQLADASGITLGFRGAPRPLLPAMLLAATTNPSAGQEHPDVAQSQQPA
ncbi:hypothetical protein Tco_0773551 [Tanacetum coccineum]|uniref:Uncharacterized protein n=1 Tax=Tanacetum coccineum TaxID=301880 RepID=A0ABQ4ZL69_9ASTR